MLKRIILGLVFCLAWSAGGHSQGITGQAAAPNPNLLLNPSHFWDQRNEGSSAGTGADNVYLDDEWFLRYTLGGGATLTSFTAKVADAPTNYTFSDKIVVNSGASASSGDYLGFSQKIEGNRL